ncbi:hypothetical protein EVAR_18918_1 [Eumeta japonica]|uniref:Uncharacterized protein n=1 Tax=Eumeta variegata TaxID=151549 RepID=A0A4C1V3G5_EUMVA|nr:hypothetical protein EVAR_18918_1 [Eumeta japonica]
MPLSSHIDALKSILIPVTQEVIGDTGNTIVASLSTLTNCISGGQTPVQTARGGGRRKRSEAARYVTRLRAEGMAREGRGERREPKGGRAPKPTSGFASAARAAPSRRPPIVRGRCCGRRPGPFTARKKMSAAGARGNVTPNVT